jgi:hypothetical protein
LIADIGDLVTLWQVFRDGTGAQADPDTVTLTVRKPDGTVYEETSTAAEAEDEAAAEEATGATLSGVDGVYKAEIDVDQSGTWRLRWDGTGAVQESATDSFYVRPDMVGEVSES